MSRSTLASEDGRAARLLIPRNFKQNHFNAIRIGMAMLVIWSHCFAIYYGSEANEPISRLMAGTYNAGNVGVRVFFIISGFLITASFLSSTSLLAYLRKRVARIYPGFLVAVMICAFVVVPLFSTHVDLSARAVARVIAGAFVLQAYFPASDVFASHPGPAVNGALWSIPYEFWCYLGVAALGLPGLLRRPPLIVAALALIMATKTWLDLHGLKPGGGIIGAIIGWPYLWFSIAPCFLVGMLVYLYRDRLPRSHVLAVVLLIALIASAHLAPLVCDLLFPPVTAYLTFYVAMGSWRVPDAAYFGDFSYGSYLYGYAIQQMLIDAHPPFALYVPVALLASLAAGIASWFLVERHFLSAKRTHEIAGQGVPATAEAGSSG